MSTDLGPCFRTDPPALNHRLDMVKAIGKKTRMESCSLRAGGKIGIPTDPDTMIIISNVSVSGRQAGNEAMPQLIAYCYRIAYVKNQGLKPYSDDLAYLGHRLESQRVEEFQHGNPCRKTQYARLCYQEDLRAYLVNVFTSLRSSQ